MPRFDQRKGDEFEMSMTTKSQGLGIYLSVRRIQSFSVLSLVIPAWHANIRKLMTMPSDGSSPSRRTWCEGRSMFRQTVRKEGRKEESASANTNIGSIR